MYPDTIDNLGPAFVGPAPPANPVQGDLWADTTEPLAPILKVYVQGIWFPAIPDKGGGPGVVALPVVDPMR